MKFHSNKSILLRSIVVCILLIISLQVIAQGDCIIKGKVKDESNQSMPFATVCLNSISDTSLLAGTITDRNGNFIINFCNPGKYLITVRFVGYSKFFRELNVDSANTVNTGIIRLRKNILSLEETTILGERKKAKSVDDKTIYYVNSSLKAVSASGVDIIEKLPGVQKNLLQNTGIAGAKNIIIMVDGKKRDYNYLRQIKADDIDRVEISTMGDSRFKGDTEGYINVVLKNRKEGFRVGLNTEIPASGKEVYMFPSLDLNYTGKNIFTFISYNGELSYFDIENSGEKVTNSNDQSYLFTQEDKLRQKNWSHILHYGLDFSLDSNNQLNFYGYYNPYSWEQDGKLKISSDEMTNLDKYKQYRREDTNINQKFHYNLFYSHSFNSNEQEIWVEAQHSELNVNQEIEIKELHPETEGDREIISNSDFSSKESKLASGFKGPVGEHFNIQTGVEFEKKNRETVLQNALTFTQNRFFLFGKLSYIHEGLSLSAGSRLEMMDRFLPGNQHTRFLYLLPAFSYNHRISDEFTINFLYRKTLSYPGIQQQLPINWNEDAFFTRTGNPELKPVVKNRMRLNFSLSKGVNHFKTGLFFNRERYSISENYRLTDNSSIESIYQNFGSIHKYGIDFTGAWKLSSIITLNHHLSVFRLNSVPFNSLETSHTINSHFALQSGITALLSLPDNYSMSLKFQYNSPVRKFHIRESSDPLYFVSLNKEINPDFSLGFSLAVPFIREISYYNYEVETPQCKIQWDGKIKTSIVPAWVHVKYNFRSGELAAGRKRNVDFSKDIHGKGF